MNKLLKYLFILGLITSSFTSLRIGSVGPSEILFVFFIVLMIVKYKGSITIQNNLFTKFWVLFIFFGILGSVLSWTYYQNYIGYGNRELIAYCFIFIFFIFTLNYLRKNSSLENEGLIKELYYLNSIIFTILFLYSIFSSTFLGINLNFFETRLSLLSENPHQLSFYIGAFIFVGIYLFKKSPIFQRILIIIFTIIYISIGLSTESTTFLMSLSLAIIFCLVIKILNIFGFDRRVFYLLMSAAFFMAVMFIYILIYEFNFIYAFFASDANGIGRVLLWKDAIVLSIDNLLFGYGFENVIPLPGILYGTSEAHNLFLDILLKGGIIPLLFLIAGLVKLFYKQRYNYLFNGILVFYLVYSLSGFTLKRIIFWFFIAYLIVLIQKKKDDINE